MINIKAIPKKEPYYIRQENLKYRIISDLGYDFSLLVNSTAENILTRINGVDTLDKILFDLYNKYPTIDKTTIYKDTNNILIDFLKSKIITFDNNGGELDMDKREIYKNDNSKVKVFHFNELGINDILAFFKNTNSRKIILNEFDELLYNELTIREALFSYKEEFYGIYIDNCLEGLISFKRKSSMYGDYYRNGILMYLNNIKEWELNCLLKTTTKDIMNDDIYNCKLIRFSFIDEKENHIAYLLKKIGYTSVTNESDYFIGNYIEYILDYNDL